MEAPARVAVCPRCRAEYAKEVEVCAACQTDLCDPEDLSRIGTRLSNYEIEGIIGLGGMGVVYKARHATLLKPMAIKVLNERYGKARDSAQEMLREAQTASRIRHPHIVDVTDFGTTPDGAAYFVMEFLEGESLNAALARGGRLPVGRALRIARQVGSALAAAHQAGIVHRDLKPENVFLLDVRRAGPGEGDFVKLLDFGLAKVMDMGPSSRTRAGVVAGTPWYMSPEQAQNRPVDGRSDIYSLGVVLYQMVTGTVPFLGSSAVDILVGHISKAPIQPYHHCPAIDEESNSLIMRCLEKDPAARFQTMEELLEAIDRAGPRLALEAGELLTSPAPAPATSPASKPTVTRAIAERVLVASAPLAPIDDGTTPPPLPTKSKPTVASDLVGRVLGGAEAEARPPSLPRIAPAAAEGRPPSLPRVPAPRAVPPPVEIVAETEVGEPAGGAGAGVPVAGEEGAAAAVASSPLAASGRFAPRTPIAPRRGRYLALAAALLVGAGIAIAVPLLRETGAPPRPEPPTPAPARVRIGLQGLPAHARVFLDGRLVAERPLLLARGAHSHRLVVEADGFRSEERRFQASASQDLLFELQAATAQEPPRAPEEKGKRPARPRVKRRPLTAKKGGAILGKKPVAKQAPPVAEKPVEGKVPTKVPQVEPREQGKKAKAPPAAKKRFRDWIEDPDL